MLLQLPNYFSNFTNIGKTLTANLRNIGKMLFLNIGPEFCEVNSAILYNCTFMHHFHCSELNYQTVGIFHLASCWSRDGSSFRCFERFNESLHQRQSTSTWWCSPLPCTGEGRNGLSIPRGSHPRAILPWTTLPIFYPGCPMRGHMWTALLNPIDRPPTPSILSRTSLPRPSFHPKPLHYSSHSPLILISILLLISGDIHPNPGPIDPCSVCSRRVTWGNRSIQCTGCSLWVHLSCSGLSPADFRKISPGHSWTCPMCPSSSQPPLPLTLQSHILILFCISILSHSKSPTFTHNQPQNHIFKN